MPRQRTLAHAFIALFAISTVFPIVTGLLPADQVPSALGLSDVAVAAVTVIVGLALASRPQALAGEADRAAAYRLVQLGSSVLLVLLAAFLLGLAIPQWGVLLAGLAWRTWLLLWVLPAIIASLRERPS